MQIYLLLLYYHRGICTVGAIDSSQVYEELREEMDKLSIFAGRNPLVIVLIACYRLNQSQIILQLVKLLILFWCVLEVAGLREEDIHSSTNVTDAGDPSSILSESPPWLSDQVLRKSAFSLLCSNAFCPSGGQPSDIGLVKGQ